LYHIIAFGLGLGLVIYGVYNNTKSQIQLRKQMLKKYIILYLIMVVFCNFVVIPIFSLIKN
jgi:hypothetical protein